ncbi:hypothetical protein B0H13DRAFT_2245360 [Mycena leptocephala]|nr:hypothetical protein B0H13DRAFT_2245360 [Mycena leptocephala]
MVFTTFFSVNSSENLKIISRHLIAQVFQVFQWKYEGPAAIKIKAKRYTNSCLDALLKLEGCGPWWSMGCTVCFDANLTWRCEDCFGGRLLCVTCITERHRDEPLHLLQQWEDGFFHPRTLRDLGLRYQIGHRPGERCRFVHLTPRVKGFVVLHDNSIHQLLNIGWYPATQEEPATAASLSLLRRFHLLNLQAKVAAYDFYNTLHRLPQFMHMVREYRHLQMCKRAGGGMIHWVAEPRAVNCHTVPACPQPGINLLEGWEDAPPEVSWIYRLMLSKDANFKLKGCDRSSREKDPTLGLGWAYMVANDAYLKHLSKYVAEDEISHCASFVALWSANNKRAKGLRASGLGSVSCSRHEMFRAGRTGDLQAGERYSNMDYLFVSSVIGMVVMGIIASYDIACQWGHNFWDRMKKMPPPMQLPDWIEIQFKVPKFHLPPHVKKCHGPYSFNFTKGVGRTDGESVERNWAWLNRAARFISVMGPGSRDDTLDDLCGWTNWRKTVDLGKRAFTMIICTH